MKLNYGSKVYGLTTSQSDDDYIILDLKDGLDTKEDIDNAEAVYTIEEFQKLLDEHDLQAIEIYYTYYRTFESLCIKFEFDKNKFRRKVSAIVSNSYVKAKKKIRQGDFYIGLKSFWHSYRILYKALELAKNPHSFSPLCNDNEHLVDVYMDIMEYQAFIEVEQDQIFKRLKNTYDSDLKKIQTEFRLLCPLEEDK